MGRTESKEVSVDTAMTVSDLAKEYLDAIRIRLFDSDGNLLNGDDVLTPGATYLAQIEYPDPI